MENELNSILTIKIKKKKSVTKAQSSPTTLQTIPPSSGHTGSAVSSCFSDHVPPEMKDMIGTDEFAQFGEKKEERVEDDEGIEIEEDKEFKKEMEKCDARTRLKYDPGTRTFDNRMRRATDLQECARIALPETLSTQH